MINPNESLPGVPTHREGFRPDQESLYNEIMDALRRGEKEHGIHLYIRGGKTLLMHAVSVSAIELGLASVALIVSNRTELRRQLSDINRFRENCGRIGLSINREYPIRSLAKTQMVNGEIIEQYGYLPDQIWANNEYILSATVQTLCGGRQESFLSWVESTQHQTAKPVLINIDEAQNYGTDDKDLDQRWEGLVKALRRLNCIILSYSGFPYRGDGQVIPGFKESDDAQQMPFRRWVNGAKIRDIDEKTEERERLLLEGVTTKFILQPIGGDAFVFPLAAGFKTDALCQITHNPINRKVTIHQNDELLVDNQGIQDVDAAIGRRVLRSYVHKPEVIDCCLEFLVQALYEKRAVQSAVKALIFTCSDRGDGESDRHAKAIKKALKRNWPALRASIITGNSELDATHLLKFGTSDDDVLILKNIGREGFDCPQVKVILDLSTERAIGIWAQTILRASTPFHGMAAEIITPADPASMLNFDVVVRQNKGEMSRTTAKVEDRDTVEVTKKTVDVQVGELVPSLLTDQNWLQMESTKRKLIAQFKVQYPPFTALLETQSIPKQWEVVNKALNYGWKLDVTDLRDESEPKDPATVCQHYRELINQGTSDQPALVDQYMQARCGGRPRKQCEADGMDMHVWNVTRATAIRASKKHVGLKGDEKPEDITSVIKWENMFQWWKNEIARLAV